MPFQSQIVSWREIQVTNDSKVLSLCVILDATAFFKHGPLDGLPSIQCHTSVNRYFLRIQIRGSVILFYVSGSGRPIIYGSSQIRPDPTPYNVQ
jgi:hypothetical protein